VTADLDQLNAALAGRFRLERELGRGGMATVYLARDLRHDRPVAVKVLRPELAAPRSATRFAREIHLTARLEHPGLLPLFDSGEIAGQLWYTMPYVEGGTLRERLRQGALPVREAVALMQAVLAALEYAHRQGVIHRDLKPENILLSPSGPLIADFGIARALGGAGLATTALTETGTALGTPEYMSPEQVAGGKVDARSDLYAAATILYELLAGEPPYTGLNAQAVIAKRLTEPLPRVSILRPEVPPALERVLTRALAKSPADRYASAGELGAALNAGLSGALPRDSVTRPLRRRHLLWAAATAVLAVAVSGAVLLRSAGSATPTAALDPRLVAVLPFTVTAPDSASNYLREGVVDLLGARLTGEGVPRAVDSRTLLARWRRVGGGRVLARDQALALANGLGAGQVIVGEVVRTPGRTTIRGRLLRVPGGAVAAEHTESAAAGELDELVLVDRWVNRVFFVGAGEGTGRLANFSDSAEAVKAFLSARAAHNRGEHEVAAAHYQRALAIDSTFALAAYWLTQADMWRGDLYPEHYQRAWSLRAGLSERDRAQLQAEMAIGPRYPEPYTSAEIIRAAERALALNPDRPEAWGRLGIYLLIQGAAASVADWLPRSAAALDSAMALDSSHTGPVWYRFYAALLEGNRENIRRFASQYLRAGPRGDRALITRWMAAHTLGDSAALDSLIAASARSPIRPLFDITGLTAIVGLPLDPLDRTLYAYRSRDGATREAICWQVMLLQMVAAMRGQIARSLAYADSSNRMPDCGSRRRTMDLGMADPGYGTAPDRMAREVATLADTNSDDAGALCAIEMWRLHQGDTSRVNQALRRLPRMVDSGMRQMPFGPRTCIRVLAAGLEALRGGAGPTPELERLDSLMREGVFMEMPANIANLLLARRFAARGEDARALAAVRRRIYNHNPFIAMVYPAHLQEEGRLAALTGDTAGAIKAYQHYLTLRDRPDPGAMGEEVRRVKAHLAELVGEPRR
jgi:serine/threonine-protein kinase